MSREYWLRFGSGDASDYSGLSPTFIIFQSSSTTFAPPGITEPISGTGLYQFSYGATGTIAFTVDGATTGLADADRYVSGVLDPQDWMGQRVGFTTASFGTDSADPGTLFGYMKRIQEMLEGDSNYTKSSGALTYSSRGSSQLLASKTITDDATEVDKS